MSEEEFGKTIDRRGTGSLKWLKSAETDLLPMWVADMDIAVCPEIIAAIQKRLEHPILGYTRGYASVAAALCSYLQQKHGVVADPSWIVWMPGMVPGLAMSAAAFGQDGDSLITFTPVYPPFLAVHKDARRELIAVPLREQNMRYDIDWAALEASVRPDTRLVLLCSPHNPVGRIWSREDMEQLAAFCVRHDLYLVSDEIHCDLLLEPEQTPFTTALALEGEIRKRLVVLMAASKTYNVPGLGLSAAIIPDPDTRRKFMAAKSTFVAETNPLGFAATEAAYTQGEPWRARLCDHLRANRDLIEETLRRELPQVRFTHVEATYLAWFDVRALGLAHPARHFEQHGLWLSDGADFGAPGFLRMNFGCPRSTVEEGLRRFVAAARAVPA